MRVLTSFLSSLLPANEILVPDAGDPHVCRELYMTLAKVETVRADETFTVGNTTSTTYNVDGTA
jgi:hypothetical protein